MNQSDKAGFTPLHIASQMNHTEVVQILLGAEGIEVNQSDIEIALGHPGHATNNEIKQLLIKAGAK